MNSFSSPSLWIGHSQLLVCWKIIPCSFLFCIGYLWLFNNSLWNLVAQNSEEHLFAHFRWERDPGAAELGPLAWGLPQHFNQRVSWYSSLEENSLPRLEVHFQIYFQVHFQVYWWDSVPCWVLAGGSPCPVGLSVRAANMVPAFHQSEWVKARKMEEEVFIT